MSERPEMTDEERAQYEIENRLAGIQDHVGWPLFQERLVSLMTDALEQVLDAPSEEALQFRGEARAFLKVLQEVDLASTRRDQIARGMRARYEEAVSQERAILEGGGQSPAWARRRTSSNPI